MSRVQRISGLVSSEQCIYSSDQLRAELHGFLCDGLELVVPSAVHVEVKLQGTEENIRISISYKKYDIFKC